MAEERRQREISATLMIDAGKTAMRDNVERLFAAVVGMRAPADVSHQARSMAEPALLTGFLKAGSRHETVGPSEQLFAMARRARAQLVEMPRRLDQRILLLVLSLEQRIEQALADTERGKYHLPRLADAQNVFEHQRRVGQQRPARAIHHFDIGERVDVDPMHEACKFERLVGADRIAVHDMERGAG